MWPNPQFPTDSLPTGKNSKSIYILGDSMMKHIEGWKLKESIDKNHNVYVRSFSGAKVKSMWSHVFVKKIQSTQFSMFEQVSLTLSYHWENSKINYQCC